MRIAVAAAHRMVVGGVETYLRTLLPELLARGHEVALLYQYDSDDAATHIDAGLPIARFSVQGAVPADLSRWKADVLYAHGLDGVAFEDAVLEACPRAAFFVHGHYGVCISASRCHGFPRPQQCQRRLGPACLALYHVRRCGGLNPVNMAKLYVLQRAGQRRMPRYRALFVASKYMEDLLVHNGAPPGIIHRNPIPPSGATPLEAPPPERPQTGTILFVGRLVPSKGCQDVIDALPRASLRLGRPLRLLVAGNGPAQAQFEAHARKKQVDVTFLSWLDDAARQAQMAAADLLAAPSTWPEPWGMAGVEAGCVGLPAVSYAWGGIPEWLRPGVSGELAPADPPTPDGLADAIVRALRDPAHHQRLRRGAWELSKATTMDIHMTRLERVLTQIV